MPRDGEQSLTDTIDDRVFVAPRRNRYHTYLECQGLNSAQTVIEVLLADVDDELSLCKFCSGEYSPSAASESYNLRKSLEELDPDDIGSVVGGGQLFGPDARSHRRLQVPSAGSDYRRS